MSLDWFVTNSRLNAVELNASFYRFPFANQVASWAKKGKGLRWAVKVHRQITHLHRFGAPAREVWERFRERFQPLDRCIDFYLFQLPPQFTPEFRKPLERFIRHTELGERFALECRNPEWFLEGYERWAEDLGVTLVSVDAPKLPRTVFKTSDAVYVRMHGRAAWYRHRYTRAELREVAEKVRAAGPERAYVFFNNDQDMLKNAREMLKILGAPGATERAGEGGARA